MAGKADLCWIEQWGVRPSYSQLWQSLGSCLVLLLSVGLAVLAAISPRCRVVVLHPGAAALALASGWTGYLCREAKERGLLRRAALLCFLLMTKGVRERQKNCTRHWFSYFPLGKDKVKRNHEPCGGECRGDGAKLECDFPPAGCHGLLSLSKPSKSML